MSRIAFVLLFVGTASFFLGRQSVKTDDQSGRTLFSFAANRSRDTSVSAESAGPRPPLAGSQETGMCRFENAALRLNSGELVLSNSADCERALSMIRFVDSLRLGDSRRAELQPRFRLVSFSMKRVSMALDDEIYKNLADSSVRVQAARVRFDESESLESKVMLGCWLIIHGEMLALPPAGRIATSVQVLDEGQRLLSEIKENTPEKDIQVLEAKNPSIALLLHTMTLRSDVILTSKEKSIAALIAENGHKTRLVGMYRALAQLILQADAAYHLQDWRFAEGSFKEAAVLSEEIEKHATLDKSDVLNKEQLNLLRNRRPFVFVAEPAANQPNPATVGFIEKTSLAKLLPTIAALARLRLIQGEETAGGEAGAQSRVSRSKLRGFSH